MFLVVYGSSSVVWNLDHTHTWVVSSKPPITDLGTFLLIVGVSPLSGNCLTLDLKLDLSVYLVRGSQYGLSYVLHFLVSLYEGETRTVGFRCFVDHTLQG